MDFSSKCYQIRRKPRIWSHLLKKYLMENFISCAIKDVFSTLLRFKYPATRKNCDNWYKLGFSETEFSNKICFSIEKKNKRKDAFCCCLTFPEFFVFYFPFPSLFSWFFLCVSLSHTLLWFLTGLCLLNEDMKICFYVFKENAL